MNRAEAALLLRLKALAGDSEPEVTGACFSGILSVEGPTALPFVSPFLASADPDVVAEAALALGLARLPDAVSLIVDRYRIERDASLASVLLTALAVSHQDAAGSFLLSIVESDGATKAAAAIEAVVSAGGLTEEMRAKFAAAAKRNSDPKVASAAGRL
ncbi:MAG TPA: HEAT repeat domain-containing protein [Gemmatimonadales bacterium]|nr:HEAT repeat domain-containing protein [Gemmatimonadales bacterium]